MAEEVVCAAGCSKAVVEGVRVNQNVLSPIMPSIKVWDLSPASRRALCSACSDRGRQPRRQPRPPSLGWSQKIELNSCLSGQWCPNELLVLHQTILPRASAASVFKFFHKATVIRRVKLSVICHNVPQEEKSSKIEKVFPVSTVSRIVTNFRRNNTQCLYHDKFL